MGVQQLQTALSWQALHSGASRVTYAAEPLSPSLGQQVHHILMFRPVLTDQQLLGPLVPDPWAV